MAGGQTGTDAAKQLMFGNVSTPVPFTRPKREAKPLSEETAEEVSVVPEAT